MCVCEGPQWPYTGAEHFCCGHGVTSHWTELLFSCYGLQHNLPPLCNSIIVCGIFHIILCAAMTVHTFEGMLQRCRQGPGQQGVPMHVEQKFTIYCGMCNSYWLRVLLRVLWRSDVDASVQKHSHVSPIFLANCDVCVTFSGFDSLDSPTSSIMFSTGRCMAVLECLLLGTDSSLPS